MCSYSFGVPLQVSGPLSEVSCHVQHLGVACWWVKRVAPDQRHRRQNKQQVVKARHDSQTPAAPTEPLFASVNNAHGATYARGHILNTPLGLLHNNYAAAGE